MQTIKLVVVGDGDAGKHELLLTYTGTTLKEEHIPTVFDRYAVPVIVGGEAYTLGMFDKMKDIKCVVVGDYEAGKTCLLNSYTTDKLPCGDFPTSFATCVKTVRINDEKYSLQLCDTSGQESYKNIRLNTYTGTDVFLVCFSVVSPLTFENVTDKWVPEILRFSPKTPFLLVGTQVDLRDNENTLEQALTFESGEELAHELKAVKYMECSARTQEGVKEVFEEAILATRNPKDKKFTYFCVLL